MSTTTHVPAEEAIFTLRWRSHVPEGESFFEVSSEHWFYGDQGSGTFEGFDNPQDALFHLLALVSPKPVHERADDRRKQTEEVAA